MFLERARRVGRMDVAWMSKDLGLAPETIRRDLTDRERRGLLGLVYGGAVAVERLSFEGALEVRSTRHQAQKNRIGTAVAYVKSAESVYADEGCLSSPGGAHLPPDRLLTVVSPSPTTAKGPGRNPELAVLIAGGRACPDTRRRPLLAGVDVGNARARSRVHRRQRRRPGLGSCGAGQHRRCGEGDGDARSDAASSSRTAPSAAWVHSPGSRVRGTFERFTTDGCLPGEQAIHLHQHAAVTRA